MSIINGRLRNIIVLGGLLWMAIVQSAWSQAYPTKPVKLISGYPPGGANDIVSRLLAQEFQARMGQPFIVENRPGVSGVLSFELVQKAEPDGHTLVSVSNPTVFYYHFQGKNFDMSKDLAPIGMVYFPYNLIVVNPQFPGFASIRTLGDLVAYAKTNPGKLDYTSAGNGSMGHLTGEKIQNLTGIQMQHVAYKGSGPALQDVVGGVLPIMFGDGASAMPQIKAGRVRVIAVSSAKRQKDFPDVQTISETFPGLVADPWGGLATTPGTPAATINRLSGELKAILDKPDFQDRLNKATSGVVGYQSPAEFATFVNREFDFWGKVIRDNGVKAN